MADRAFALAQKFNIQSATVSDAAAVHACLAFLNEHRCLGEPACGAALAPVLERSPAIQEMRRVVVVVCGGVGVTVEKLQEWSKEFPPGPADGRSENVVTIAGSATYVKR